MNQPIPKRLTIRVDVNKILTEHLYNGAKGKYLNLVLFNTPDNEYGNDYVVKQDIPQESRPDDVPILGNAKAWEATGGQKNMNQGQGSGGAQNASNDAPFGQTNTTSTNPFG